MIPLLDRIKNDLFIKGVKLTNTNFIQYYGMRTQVREIFYHENKLGYFLYLPTDMDVAMTLFDPINPTSFRWAMFDRRVIFVPHRASEIPFNVMYKIHPKLNIYIIRFNLEYYCRYKKVFVETENIEADQFFAIMSGNDSYYCDSYHCAIFDQMSEILQNSETPNDINNDVTIFKEIKTNRFYYVFPEFLRSSRLEKDITQNNLSDIWRHWIAEQYGNDIDNSNDRYYSKWKDDVWIDNVVSTLVVENLTRGDAPVELDSGLKALLGIK